MNSFLDEILPDDTNDREDPNWRVNQPDDGDRPCQAPDCESNCKEILQYFQTKKWVMISVTTGTHIGIDWNLWQKLCVKCKKSIRDWYSQLFNCEPYPIDIFQLQLAESNAASDWNMAEEEYGRMLTNYDQGTELIAGQELVQMSKYCRNHERTWKEAHARLQAKYKELNRKKSHTACKVKKGGSLQ